MVFMTLNSEYTMEEKSPGVFIITKTKELKPSRFNDVGQQRMSSEARVVVGECAQFDSWHTSRVVSIDTPGGPLNG